MNKFMRIAAIGDIHVGLTDQGKYKQLFTEISKTVDALCIAGDLTDTGAIEEGEVLREELKNVTIPTIMVLGNHDHEKESSEELKHILSDQTVSVLEGECIEIQGVGFAGIKGFIGGFGHNVLPFWGEKIIKDVVQVGTNDALKLERAFSLLETPKKVVIMHYSPIVETVVGESPEIYPFLGSTRFEEVINRMEGTVVFHGHAHAGTLEGKTDKDIPVFNVSLPVLRKNKKEFLVYEV